MSLSFKDIEGYLQDKGVSPECLNLKCSDGHLLTISRYVDNWETQAPFFGLEAGDVAAIKRDIGEEEARRPAMLLKWKRMKAFKATYKELVSTFLKVDRADLAERICNVLAEGKIVNRGSSRCPIYANHLIVLLAEEKHF